MNVKQNPFSLYDALGYFTPGAIFIYGLMAVYAHTQSARFSLQSVAAHLSLEKPEAYIPFVLAAYVMGHFLSFVSSITVERFSIWSLGYPSKGLLNITTTPQPVRITKEPFRRLLKTLVWCMLAPISVFDLLLKRFGLRDLYRKRLDQFEIAVIRKSVSQLIRDKVHLHKPPDPFELNFFGYAYHYAVENAPNHFPKMQNYVALYGFLRTLTLLCVVFFWSVVWHTIWGSFSIEQALGLLAGVTIVTNVLFMGFVKFYWRFSLEALMALAVTYKSAD